MNSDVITKYNELMSKLDKEKIIRIANKINTEAQKRFTEYTKDLSKDEKDAVILQMFFCGGTESEAENGT